MKEINFKVSFECKVEEELEVKTRLTKMIIKHIEKLEGLLTTSILPWKKSYYFTINNVEELE